MIGGYANKAAYDYAHAMAFLAVLTCLTVTQNSLDPGKKSARM
jgi:hypothetical protein